MRALSIVALIVNIVACTGAIVIDATVLAAFAGMCIGLNIAIIFFAGSLHRTRTALEAYEQIVHGPKGTP